MHLDISAAGRSAVALPQMLKAILLTGRVHLTWAMVIGVIVLAGHLMLLPFVARTWRSTGDEPHYLLTTHSLVYDGDLDLANNYANFDYLNFYVSKDIAPQIRVNAAGEQILNHNLGLPILIAPAYALGGYFGVLLFQALLAAVLATMTYKLAIVVGGNLQASLLAAFLMAFSPPLLMYTYLVYPELMAALLTTLVLYFALSRNRPSPSAALVTVVCLVLLPWLNRRFVLLALVLALIVVWSWRRRGQPRPGLVTVVGVLAMAATLISIGTLVGFNSQFSSLAGSDFIVPPNAIDLGLRLTRGIGWLVDQQRGLFIFAPLYILAAWGAPLLINKGIKQRGRTWLVVLPFVLALGMTTVAGGYWIAWEVGPRFLVVGLPGLAALLALAFSRYQRHKLWWGMATMLVILSLVNSWVIVKSPELAYKSSLPYYYGQKLSLPLTELLPDLAGYMRVKPRQQVAPAGESNQLIKAAKLYDLPYGHYTLVWPLQIDSNVPPQTELVRLTIKHLGGGSVFNRTITAADLPTDGIFTANFTSPGFDRWRTPMLLHAVSTGQARVQAGDVVFMPRPFFAMLLPYVLILFIGLGAVLWQHGPKIASPVVVTPKPGKVGWLGVILLLLISTGFLLGAKTRQTRTYDAAQLPHFVGRSITDPQAADGRAWLVDPALDPPQRAIYGPFDFYAAGQYQVVFWLKLVQPVEPDQELARLNIKATTNFDSLISQPVLGKHFSKPDLYHQMILTVNNPRRQALSFEVDYLGVAGLVIDGVTVLQTNQNP